MHSSGLKTTKGALCGGAHLYSNTRQAEAGGLPGVQGQPELHRRLYLKRSEHSNNKNMSIKDYLTQEAVLGPPLGRSLMKQRWND